MVMLISTTTNYVNGGLSVDLSVRSTGIDKKEDPWYAALLEEGFTNHYAFYGQQMTGDYHLWVMTRNKVVTRMGRNYMNLPTKVKVCTILEYAIVAYRHGSARPCWNHKALLGDKFSPEEYNRVMETFFAWVD